MIRLSHTNLIKSPVPAICLAGALLCFAGCAQQHSSHKSASKPGTPGAKSPAAAAKISCTESTGGLIKLAKAMPAEATLGSEFLTELTVTANGCAANVVVRDSIPADVTVVRSDPAATIDDGVLVWKIGNLDAGQTLKARVWLKTDKEGPVSSCATVTADPRVCGVTFVGKPVLALDLNGPENAILGAEVTYQLAVKNIGSAFARGVVVTNPVPAGMSHSSGKSELNFDLGDLSPGQSKPLAVTFKANQRGKICNAALVTSTNAAQVRKETCTVILVPGLKVETTGTKEQILGRNADYEIVARNTGDTTLSNVVISDVAPAETLIVAAPGATLNGNRAAWTIAEMKPGEKVTHTLKLNSKLPGTHCLTTTASAGALSDSSKTCTVWKGIAAVTLKVLDDPDPIQVGENTVYTITVFNQGFANVHTVKVLATFGAELTPVSTEKGTISGKTATFITVPSLGPKQTATGTIIAKGVKAGDARTRVVMTCDELTSPLEAAESTTVY